MCDVKLKQKRNSEWHRGVQLVLFPVSAFTRQCAVVVRPKLGHGHSLSPGLTTARLQRTPSVWRQGRRGTPGAAEDIRSPPARPVLVSQRQQQALFHQSCTAYQCMHGALELYVPAGGGSGSQVTAACMT